MRTAGLILAAGESRRMGSPKALIPFRGTTFLQHLVDLFTRYCSPVIVVVGHSRPPAARAQIAINEQYKLGQLSSMQCGLRALPPDTEGLLFTLVAPPDPAPATLERLVSLEAPISIPVHNGKKGHPVFFRSELIPEFLALPPDSQARLVVRQHAAETRYVDVDDPGILDDIDDPEALRVFRERTA